MEGVKLNKRTKMHEWTGLLEDNFAQRNFILKVRTRLREKKWAGEIKSQSEESCAIYLGN